MKILTKFKFFVAESFLKKYQNIKDDDHTNITFQRLRRVVPNRLEIFLMEDIQVIETIKTSKNTLPYIHVSSKVSKYLMKYIPASVIDLKSINKFRDRFFDILFYQLI